MTIAFLKRLLEKSLPTLKINLIGDIKSLATKVYTDQQQAAQNVKKGKAKSKGAPKVFLKETNNRDAFDLDNLGRAASSGGRGDDYDFM